MGMFDEIVGKCPECGEEMYGQTKSGPCMLDRYDIDEEHYLHDALLILDGSYLRCNKCKKGFVVSIADSLPKYVKLILIPIKTEE